MTESPRIVFIGSPDFAVPALRRLHASYNVVGVISQPDRPAGRGRTLTPPPVKQAALSMQIPVFQPEKMRSPAAWNQLQTWNPDLIVVAAFGQILKQDVLNLPKFGCINIHASLLPRWRGAAPINAAILAGDKEAGVTIMKMDAGIDTGDMLARRAILIKETDTAGELTSTLAQLGAELLLEILPDYLLGEITQQKQDEASATYAPMMKKEDGLLNFSEPAELLARKVRAYHPWPGAWMLWQGAPLKIHKAHVVDGGGEAGKRVVQNGLPAVVTSNNILVFDELQPAGKKTMSGKSFLAGARDW